MWYNYVLLRVELEVDLGFFRLQQLGEHVEVFKLLAGLLLRQVHHNGTMVLRTASMHIHC